MTLAAPSLAAGEPLILLAAKACLTAQLSAYLTAQVTGLASAGVTMTLPVPQTIVIGEWPQWRTDTGGQLPALLLYLASDTQWSPDVAGGTYQCESSLGVGIVLAEADAGVTSPGDVYLASIAYAQAVAYCLQRHLSAATYADAAGIYACVIATTGADAAPIEQPGGMLLRCSETTHTVRWQALQEPPGIP